MKIADVHAHVFPEKLAVKAAGSIGQFYGAEMYCEASMERLVAEEEKAGVSRYVISSSAVVPKQVRSIVEFLAEARKGHPECISFGSIYPGMDGYEEVLDELQALGSRGLKIHPDFQKLPIDDPSGIETYRSIARRGRCAGRRAYAARQTRSRGPNTLRWNPPAYTAPRSRSSPRRIYSDRPLRSAHWQSHS